MSAVPPLTASEVTLEDLYNCTRIFEAIAADTLILAKLTEQERIRLFMAAGRAMHPDQAEIKRRLKAIRRAHGEAKREVDRSARSATTIRATRTHSVFVAPPRVLPVAEATIASELTPRELQNPDICYICKSEFTTLHHFYDSLCPSCAEFNYEKRFQTCSLQGRVALITGARLKIGYHAALMMLRAGATVIVTTRFPKDAALRYAKEPDFQEWKTRLKVYGLDLRHSPSVEAFTRYIEATNHRLDFLINNAAQTVRRPPGFYAHLLKVEDQPLHEFSADVQMILQGYEECKASLVSGGLDSAAQAGTAWVAEWHKGKALGLASSAHLSQIPYACDDAANLDPKFFPMGKLDADLQQVDLRQMNSWRMTLGDVPTAELLEVQLINSIAPFILCSKLKPLMLRDETGDKHIVNVSAMEGKFSRHTKTDKHPHTNMAKAALNMMTLTSARDYAEEGIYMNAVDTGWVTDEDPAEIVIRKQKEHDFQPPLDIVDGAARVMDPIFSGLITGQHNWGNFLKDYMPTEW